MRKLLPLLLAVPAAGCLVGPNYHRPAVATPPAYKEAAGWTPAQPSDAADRSDWWTVFGDPTLDSLEARVATSNQTLAAAEAAYRAAHALVALDRAQLLPTVTAGAGALASGGGAHRLSERVYQVSLGGTWAIDLWGQVRRQVRGAKAEAQASAALVADAKLSAQTELAADYISLRELDEETRILDETAAAEQRTLEITQNKYAAGAVSRADMLNARSQLESTQATDVDLVQQRARFEHAIAILVGEPPAALDLAPGPWTLKVPAIPASAPSTLLERRPDIASAERDAAAASEQIGVAVAAFFPTLNLTGAAGFSASNLAGLFNASSALWSAGASAAETLFNGGARLAKVRQARATYDEAVANYRQTVLAAFQNVEDDMAAQRVFEQEETLRAAASADADANLAIARNEYAAGTVDFTTVAAAQVTALQSRQVLVQIQANRLTTAVSLIEALGGGWTAKQLPRS